MTASRSRRLARLDQITAHVAEVEQERREAADLSRELLAEGMTPAEIAEHGPYSAAWLRNVRAEMKRRGEVQ